MSTLLITGASGHLGRRVAELLLKAGQHRVVLATRTPAKLADLAARGAVVRAADFDDPASLATAFTGVDRLLLVSTDHLDQPGRRLTQHRAAITAAAAAGVRHLVYTSLLNAVPDSVMSLAPDHAQTEQALAASPLTWTVLRNNLYADNLLPGLGFAVATGQLHTASGTGAISYLTREDCARAAAAALASTETANRTLDLTGPAALTAADIAALTTQITGRTVTHVPVPADGLRAGLTQAGLPAGLVEALVTFDLAAARGELHTVSPAFTQLTGRAPTPVAIFLAAHRAQLAPPALA
jgi:NAD(P)H dehydrogenase (quinone)